MSQPLWSKTTLAQAIGLAVTGTTVTTGAQAEQAPSLTLTTYKNLNFRSKEFASYATEEAALKQESADTLKLTLPMKDSWDAAVTLSRTTMEDSSAPKYMDTTVKTDADYQTIDFEAGYNNKLGSRLETRVSAGLRYIDLKQDTSTSFQYATGPTTFIGGPKYGVDHDLKALGLRLGGEGKLNLGAGISLSGGVGASLLQARRESDYYDKYNNVSSNKENETLYGVDSEMAVNFDMSPKTPGGATASLGYSYAKMYNLLQTDIDVNTGRGVSDLAQEGWFVRLNTTF